jgi:pectate lyase
MPRPRSSLVRSRNVEDVALAVLALTLTTHCGSSDSEDSGTGRAGIPGSSGASGGVSGGATAGRAASGSPAIGGSRAGTAGANSGTSGSGNSAGAAGAGGSGASGSSGTPGSSGEAGSPGNAGSTSTAGQGGASGGAGTGTAGSAQSGSAGKAAGGGGNGGAPSGGSAGSGTSGSAGTAGKAGTCPLELVGFATVEGGTTGGGDTAPTTVTTQAELKACATASGPRVCRVQGTLTFSPFEEIRVASDKTIIGAGSTAEIVMGGFFLDIGVHNVIIRNLTFRDSYVQGQDDAGGDDGGDRDGVQMDTAHHVWIDHCRFRRLGDGLIDSRKDTTFETVSWNILEDHNKTFGIGWTENVTAQITIHHNWIRNTTQRNPSADNILRAHLFNNVLENVTSYGNYSRGGTNMVLQNSVFVNVKDPHYYDTGTLVATGNVYRGTTGQMEASGTTFSFFDPSTYYPYTLDPTSSLEALIARCAGPRPELGN